MRLKRNHLALALVTLILSWPVMANTAAQAEGVTWRDMTIEEALAEAKSTGKMIMIDVAAEHCMACGDMDEELWTTPEGAELADGLIPLRIDSTTPEGEALNRYFPITGLPVVVFVSSDGLEVDRVVGYDGKSAFLAEARPLKDGFDPLPMLEEELAAHPDSLPLIMPVLERYLYRSRDEEAKALLSRLLELDPENRHRQAEKGLMKFARHARIIWDDMEKSLEYWKMILERFPNSSSVSGAVMGTQRASAALGRHAEWKKWICEIAEKQSGNARLQYSLAMAAKRSHLRGSCFAKAARTARALGMGTAYLDTLAIELEGGKVPGR